MRVYCIQHVAEEGPGEIGRWMAENGHDFIVIRTFENPHWPEPAAVDALVVMGGPMGVYDEALYPWMPAEKQFIKQVIAARKKVMGICLGAQLIAEALGASVYPHRIREIGWFPVYRASVDGLSPLPNEQVVFHWHGDTFDLPAGAIQLMYSEACLQQGFCWQGHVLGLQFHLELGQEELLQMLQAGEKEIHQALCDPQQTHVQAPEQLLRLAPLYMPEAHRLLRRLLKAFFYSNEPFCK
ncbi:MAG: amidotransferase [Thermoflavifilum sp.]|nr:amidotransferase [Thermoflavifilum sp.]